MNQELFLIYNGLPTLGRKKPPQRQLNDYLLLTKCTLLLTHRYCCCAMLPSPRVEPAEEFSKSFFLCRLDE